jgi:hypothetical protein
MASRSNLLHLDEYRSAQGAPAGKILRPANTAEQGAAAKDILAEAGEGKAKAGSAAQVVESLMSVHFASATWADLFRKLGSGSESRSVERDIRSQRTATKAERDAWASFLLSLPSNIDLTQAQRTAVVDVWQRAIETEPNVMYPTVGSDPEAGTVYLAWNPRGLSFVVEIDSDGKLQWHFADHRTHHADGSEEWDVELEPKALTLLRLFRRTENVGRAAAGR